jgi:hypothetical protein
MFPRQSIFFGFFFLFCEGSHVPTFFPDTQARVYSHYLNHEIDRRIPLQIMAVGCTSTVAG